MTVKSVLVRPRARAPTCPPCYAIVTNLCSDKEELCSHKQ